MSSTFPARGDIHPAARAYARECAHGALSRRDFLSRATALGVSAAGAYGLIGLARPARAAGPIRTGGTLRIQQDVLELSDPRLYQWSEMGNLTRGLLEYLVRYNRDGTFSPVLLEGWEVNTDATQYRLTLRQGVTWNNGDAFTAEDVARNFALWCDSTVEGNSMATRMGSLVDPGTGQLIPGGVEVVDDRTVLVTLPQGDITLVSSLSDYPAAIVHASLAGGNPIDTPIGTGPYLPEDYIPGERSTWVRNPDHTWWNAGNGAYLDRVEFIDTGTDPASILAAIDADAIDMVYESIGDFVDILDTLGMTRSEVATAATVVTRPNQGAEVGGIRPYEDVRTRRALQMAVDNAIVLELGYANRGAVAENHHVSPIHPEYAQLPPQPVDPKGARALMTEAGMAEFEHELVSLDDAFERDTTDAVAAQLRDAGFRVNRRVIPGATFWSNWTEYPFSSTSWNHRPFGIQVLALAYKSGVPWNETGFSNAEFDRILEEAAAITDANTRREHARRLQTIMQEEGVTIQAYWRTLYRHAKPGIVNAEMHPQFEIHFQEIGYTA